MSRREKALRRVLPKIKYRPSVETVQVRTDSVGVHFQMTVRTRKEVAPKDEFARMKRMLRKC